MKVFPTALMYFETFQADIERRKVSGGTALSGEEDIVETDGGGRWIVTASNPDLDDPETALAWDAWDGLLGAGATPFIMPLTDARSQMLGEIALPIGGIPWWDETDFGTPDTGVTLAADAALRATTMTVTIAGLSGPLRFGQRFSIDHTTWRHRAYRVIDIQSDDGETVTFTFVPPLREATTAGAQIDFLDPKCVMRIEGGMRAPRTLGYADSDGATFVEFPGAPT